MTKSVATEHYNPLPLSMLGEALAAYLADAPGAADFQDFAKGVVLLYDAQFSQKLEHLKRLYFPFNPEREVTLPEWPGRDKGRLLREIRALLREANFQPLDQAAIEAALNKTSPHGVEVSVDLREFEEVLIFFRGSCVRSEEPAWWRRLLGKTEPVEIPIYQRLFVLLQLRSAARHGMPTPIHIKVFREIPHSDLETLFPNTKVRLRRIDKIKLGVTGGGGAVGGFLSAVGKLTAAASPMAALGAIGAMAGIIWKQVDNVLRQRTEYMAKLAKSLYFYNLDNDAGALAWLVETASSEEAKEVLLAYAMLHRQGPMTAEALDRAVEGFLKARFGISINYQVRDGVRKLAELGLLHRAGDGVLGVPGPCAACRRLEQIWDALFPVPGNE